MFREYVSAMDEVRDGIVRQFGKRGFDLMKQASGLDFRDFETVYGVEINGAKSLPGGGDAFAHDRLQMEREWYRQKRPYFNIYPIIESKLLAVPQDLELGKITLPFTTLEIRTSKKTFLVADQGDAFFFVIDRPNGEYQEFAFPKRETAGALNSMRSVILQTTWPNKGTCPSASAEEIREISKLVVGVCLLSHDKSIVLPVVLNKDQARMDAGAIGDAAARAIEATGRVGFTVGKCMERADVSTHYRNGCLAVYYVTQCHPCYPKNGKDEREPVLLWRSGAIVNKDKPPTIPTGYRDVQQTEKEIGQ